MIVLSMILFVIFSVVLGGLLVWCLLLEDRLRHYQSALVDINYVVDRQVVPRLNDVGYSLDRLKRDYDAHEHEEETQKEVVT